MRKNKLLVGAVTAAVLVLGGGAALAAGLAPETTVEDQEESSVNGSVKAPAEQDEGQENEAVEDQQEQAEDRQIEGLAKIDQAEAEKAALDAVPGTVEDAELGDENGYVVWELEVTADDGSTHDILVDAGNGKVLAQGADEENEGAEANEPSEGAEASEEAEANEPGGSTN